MTDTISALFPRDTAISGTDEFLDLISNPFGDQIASTSIVAAAIYSFSISGGLAILFCFLRPRTSTVYAPRAKYADSKHAPPKVGRGFFSWITPIRTVRESELVEKIGVDATVFLRFMRMSRNIFLCLAILGMAILVPLNFVGSDAASDVATVMKLIPQYIHGTRFWGFVVLAWVFNIIICFFLWYNYKAVVKLRRAYFESPEYQSSLHSRTLMLTHIPRVARTDDGIVNLVEMVRSTEDMPRAAIARNTKELPELIEEHEEAVQKLEKYLATYLRNPNKLPPNRPTCKPDKHDKAHKGQHKVDAIDYLTGRIQELETEIREVRESLDKRNPLPYGFASYTHIEDAHAVAYAGRKKRAQGADLQLAPRPSDLLWKNLPMSRAARRTKFFWSSIGISILTVVYIGPNMLTAVFLSNLKNLGYVWPWFQTSLEAHPIWWSVLQGIASPALQQLFYLFLPTIFRRASARSGDLTKTARERHVLNRLYAFFVFNNLVIFSLFSTIWSVIASIVKAKNDNFWDTLESIHLAVALALALCSVSPYWITWSLQRNLGAAVDLIQAWPLITSTFKRHFLNPTPRQLIEFTAPPPFHYADYYNNYLFVATVTLAYGTIQPLILPIAAFYFCIDTWLKKYLLQYVFVTKTESGGLFWRNVFNRYLFATLLSDVVIALMVAAQGTDYTMLYVMAPLPFLLLAFKIYCARNYDTPYRYYTTKSVAELESGAAETVKVAGKSELKHAKRSADRVGFKFGHPALYKKLMTPMVHAKSQHLLKGIYRGRLDTDNDGDTAGQNAYSDIYLSQMSHDHPGKAVQFPPEKDASAIPGFEIVAEADLDFENFKRRAEFREMHGGEGELYGHSGDASTSVSEISRPGTPSTMTTVSTNAAGFRGPGFGRGMARSESSGSSTRGDSRSGRETGPLYPKAHYTAEFGGGSPDAKVRQEASLRFGSADIGASSLYAADDAEGEAEGEEFDDRGRLLSQAAGMGRAPLKLPPGVLRPAPTRSASRGGRVSGGEAERGLLGGGLGGAQGRGGFGGDGGAGYFGGIGAGSGFTTSAAVTPTPLDEEDETSYEYFRRGGRA